jgi:hypothetical protein
MGERRHKMETEWKSWRKQFGTQISELSQSIRRPTKKVILNSFKCDVSESVDSNISSISTEIELLSDLISSSINSLRNCVYDYLSKEILLVDEFSLDRKNALIGEWSENLYILNSSINR